MAHCAPWTSTNFLLKPLRNLTTGPTTNYHFPSKLLHKRKLVKLISTTLPPLKRLVVSSPPFIYSSTTPTSLSTPHASSPLMPRSNGDRRCARELLPLLAWICGITVALLIRYGYYGNRSLAVGPNSSRMLKTSSVLVEEVRIQGGEESKGLLIYGFAEPPELSLTTNWTALHHLSVQPYGTSGFSLWLNEGSKIRLTWQITHGSVGYEDMYVVVTKGEHDPKESHTFHKRPSPRSALDVADSSDGAKQASYEISEDDSYYIGIVNLNPHRMESALTVDFSSKVYDTREARSVCSVSNGLCKLKLRFPNTQYFVLATTDDDVLVKVWNVQLSFVARLAAYFLVVGSVVLVVYLILNQLGACESATTEEVGTEASETEAIVPVKEPSLSYNTNEEDPTSSLCCYSDDTYEKICAICYDDVRNCFFTPCGHSIACRTCAKR